MSDLPRTADVVIVGGGVVGASIAFHLARRGVTDVVVLERDCAPGLGATGRATGGIRAQFDDPIEMRWSLHAMDEYHRFDELTGVDAGYRRNGYLYFATDPGSWDALRARTAALQANGLDAVSLLDPAAIAARVPGLAVEDVLGGSFGATDGFIDPSAILRGYLRGARAQGVRLCVDAPCEAVVAEAGRVTAVRTPHGTISTPCVVNAGGAWSTRIAEPIGAPLPLRPLRRQVAGTPRLDEIPDDTPMVADFGTGLHFRKDHLGTGGVLLLWGDPAEPYGEQHGVDPAWLPQVWARARRRLPCVERVGLTPSRCWAGLYAVTPDHRPLLGPVSAIAGLHVATGFSGHGVMHAPVTGQMLAEWIVDGAPRCFDGAPFAADRFADADPDWLPPPM